MIIDSKSRLKLRQELQRQGFKDSDKNVKRVLNFVNKINDISIIKAINNTDNLDIEPGRMVS